MKQLKLCEPLKKIGQQKLPKTYVQRTYVVRVILPGDTLIIGYAYSYRTKAQLNYLPAYTVQ